MILLVSISKGKYNEPFHNIENRTVSVNVVVNKRGRTLYQANRMVLTCTVRDIQKKLFDKGHSVSYGKVASLKPFFITYPTDKEVALCLCKLCLNVRLITEPLMKKTKEDGDKVFESANKFFMSSCDCDKGANGYYKWKFVNLKCKDCKDSSSPDLKCKTSKEQVKVSQFQQTETPYKKFDKTLGKEIEKISRKPKKVQLEMLYEELVKKVWKMRKQYLVHKYEVFNDMHHWPVILSTASEMGPIYHMDFSENRCQMHKFEPQSSHFNKAQYSLHCTVRHAANGKAT